MTGFLREVKELFSGGEVTLNYVKFAWCEFLLAAAYNLFLVPNHLVAGGSGGLGILFNSLFGIEPSVVVFIFCLFVFLLAVFFLEVDQILPTLFVLVFYPLFIKVTANIGFLITIDEGNVLLMVIFGAIVTGFFQGYILKTDLNFGGISVIAKVIYKYTNISVTFTNALINAIIVALGGFFIGFTMVIYAILFLIILRIVSESVVLGRSRNKTFKIITSHYKAIEKFIEKELGHDVTVYETYGAYTGDSKRLLMTVIPNSEFTLLRDYVKSVDKSSFIFITDTYALEGQDLSISKAR